MLADDRGGAATRSKAGIDRDELQQLMPPGGAPQRDRLRAVGARGAREPAGRPGSSPGSTPPRAAGHHLHARRRRSGGDGRRRARLCRGARDQGQADRRARARSRAGRRRCAPRGPTSGSASTPIRASRGATSTGWSRRWSSTTSRCSSSRCARGREADLDGFDSPIPIAADESAARPRRPRRRWSAASTWSTSSSTNAAALPRALAMAAEARRLGLGVMVGNMVGTSLAMAPGLHPRPALRHRRSRRPDLPRRATASPAWSIATG